jgi:hypothetical protein
MSNLRAAAQQALDYMDSVGQQDMYPEEWAIAEALRAALAQEEREDGPATCWKCGAEDGGTSCGEYWYKCDRCCRSDWITRYGTMDQLMPRECKPVAQQEQEEPYWLTKELMADYLDMIAEAIEENRSEMLRHKAHWMRTRGEV